MITPWMSRAFGTCYTFTLARERYRHRWRERALATVWTFMVMSNYAEGP